MKPGTPLPWRWANGSIWTGENVSPNSDAWTYPDETGETRIAAMDRDEPKTYGAERDQNGAYIVHAANMYPELVATCQSVLQICENKGTTVAVAALHAILAKCEGE